MEELLSEIKDFVNHLEPQYITHSTKREIISVLWPLKTTLPVKNQTSPLSKNSPSHMKAARDNLSKRSTRISLSWRSLARKGFSTASAPRPGGRSSSWYSSYALSTICRTSTYRLPRPFRLDFFGDLTTTLEASDRDSESADDSIVSRSRFRG